MTKHLLNAHDNNDKHVSFLIRFLALVIMFLFWLEKMFRLHTIILF